MLCADANSFSLDNNAANAKSDAMCTLDFVGIAGTSYLNIIHVDHLYYLQNVYSFFLNSRIRPFLLN